MANLQGVVLANGQDGNCAVAGGTIVSGGDNTSSDTSCENVLDEPGDQNDVDVPLPSEESNIYLPLVVE